jgi:hypothetical protein
VRSVASDRYVAILKSGKTYLDTPVNRHHRRATAKNPNAAVSDQAKHDKSRSLSDADLLVAAAAQKPNFVLKAISKVLLSSWVLNRVSDKQVLLLLQDVALQTGRPDVIIKIRSKL